MPAIKKRAFDCEVFYRFDLAILALSKSIEKKSISKDCRLDISAAGFERVFVSGSRFNPHC